MEVLARADLHLVPAAVAEDQTVQHAEPVALVLSLRRPPGRANELTRAQARRAVAVGEQPAMRRRRVDRAPVPRDVPGRQAHAAVAVALLERGRELDLDQRLAPEPADVRG